MILSACKEALFMRIALTFDDGPNTVTTPQILDILEVEGIVA